MRKTAPAELDATARDGWGVRCYFCGVDTAKLSEGDLDADLGRIQVYCDNEGCAAREATILVERNGSRAAWRADVRALKANDQADAMGNAYVHPGGLITQKPQRPDGPDVLAPRLDEGPQELLIP